VEDCDGLNLARQDRRRREPRPSGRGLSDSALITPSREDRSIEHVVGISDCKASNDPPDVIVTHALGSCVGLALYDPHRRVGGLLHVLLPDSGLRRASPEFNPYMYADSGVNALLEAVLALGAKKTRLIAKAAGGANMLRASLLLDIGRRNSEAIVAALQRERIPLLNSSLGGTVGRSMALRLDDGSAHVRLFGQGDEIL